MRCASRGFANPAGAKFCIECGGAVTHACRSCGCENLPHAKFCANCGTAIAVAEKPLPAKSRKRQGTTGARQAQRPVASPTTAKSRPAAREAERRQLTVTFCDLVGSTTLSTARDLAHPFTLGFALSCLCWVYHSRPLNPDSQGGAETCFLQAIEVACRQQAKSWELCASMSLARLWQQQGKQKEAHDMLSEISGWFTEGFDTKDLQEAKALLDAWAEER
jgi:hypothetical protein